MRRSGTTPYALLGLLSIQPMSGYDIRKAIQDDLIYFWNESFGQIYPTLKNLQKQGLIAPARQHSVGRRLRQAYSLTAKGRQHLRNWLLLPPQNQPIRNEYLLKLFLGKTAPSGAICRHLRRYNQEQQDLLSTFTKIRAHIEVEHRGKADQKFWLVMIDHGIRIRRAELAWSLAALKALCSGSHSANRPSNTDRQS